MSLKCTQLNKKAIIENFRFITDISFVVKSIVNFQLIRIGILGEGKFNSALRSFRGIINNNYSGFVI